MEDAAVGFLLEQVKGVIKGYANLISGAATEFRGLKDDLETLRATLKDIAKKSSKEHRPRVMLKQIREAVYEVEDTIDSWLTEGAELRANKMKRWFIWLCWNHISLAKQVKSLRQEKVGDLMVKATNMVPVGTSMEEHANETITCLPIRKDRYVRLDDTEGKIIGLLTTYQTELDIIALIGMPGLGKTTVADKVFENQQIRSEFQVRIWVRFSHRLDSRGVLLQIMKHFTNNYDEISRMSDVELPRAVHACLNRGKFLLVMDGVWETEQWNYIKNALPYENGEGKVLITSCNMKVGRCVEHITKPLLMRFLTNPESWELLQLEVFGNLKSCPKGLQEIGKSIAEECEGVPMTIVVIGGVLKDSYLSLGSVDMVYDKWKEISGNVHLQGNRNKAISDAVELNYKGLPDHLRECFLYLGVFPAGYNILTRTLTCLWIAEGFIQHEDNRSLEEIAMDNLNELISRNLLIAHKTSPMREVKVCRVQEIVRVFCIGEAENENLFKEVRMPEEKKPDMEKIHRLCLHSGVDEFFSANLKGPHVRSFLCFQKNAPNSEFNYNSVILENYPPLRVMHSKSIKFSQFPQNASKLNHLRYIVLSVVDLKKLPQSLSQLWNLQTIKVDTNSDLLTMEANIWKMVQLRHVRTKAAIVLDNSWEDDAAENLLTLNRLSPDSVTAAFSEKARTLRTLGIRGNLASLFANMPLGNMKCLKKLKLYQVAASVNQLQRFPDSNRFPPNLKRLTLSKTFLDWKNMTTLANIPDLEVLKLKENAFTGISWEAEHHTFNKLQVLHILNSNLVIWTAKDSTFPRLRHLELKKCEKLNAIPDGILQRLENLDIGRVRKSIAYSAKNMALHLYAADLI